MLASEADRDARSRFEGTAGFVNANGDCFGKSETLNLDSRMETDSNLLAEQ